MRRWDAAFAPHAITVAQVLLTADGVAARDRFLNARHTLQALLSSGAVPVVNENDTVATDEIRFGDNDHLSIVCASVTGADAVVLVTDWPQLSDVDWMAVQRAMRGNVLIDGRNFLDPVGMRAAGLVYEGIGRAAEDTGA